MDCKVLKMTSFLERCRASYWYYSNAAYAKPDLKPEISKCSKQDMGINATDDSKQESGSSDTGATRSTKEFLDDSSDELPVNNSLSKEEIKSGLSRNQKIAIGAGAVIGAGSVVVAAPLVLGAVGFGSNGVVGGSIAAGIQSAIGNVATGSAFAACQSAGAAGIGAATNAALATAGAVVGGANAGGAAVVLSRKNEDGERNNKPPETSDDSYNASKNADGTPVFCESCRKIIETSLAAQADRVSESTNSPEKLAKDNYGGNSNTSDRESEQEYDSKRNIENNGIEIDAKGEEQKKYCASCKRAGPAVLKSLPAGRNLPADLLIFTRRFISKL